MTLLVSIHDVTPALAEPVERLWALCRARGITPALLVVPDWHGRAPLAAHPAYLAWLRARAADGAEIILHGERHDEVGSPRALRDALRAFGRTNREGEFLTLGRSAARARIDRGLALLRGAGLAPVGFIPPAWLATEEGFAAVADAGLRFSEDDSAIRLHPGGRIPSPAVRWSGRSARLARGSALVAWGRWQLQRSARVVRLALHPGDLAHPASARSVERALDRWPSVRPVVPYRSLWA